MGVGQHLQRVIVLCVDDGVERLVAPTLYSSGLHKAGVDAVVELRHDHQFLSEHRLRLRLLRVQFQQVGDPAPIHAHDPLHPPQSLVALLDLATRGQHPHLVPTTHSTPRQLHGLGLVLLEDQAEGPPLHQGGELLLQVVTELLVGLAGLAQ